MIGGRAAEIRHLALYTLVVIGLFFATFNTAGTLAGMWRRVADGVVPLTGISQSLAPAPPPQVEPDPRRPQSTFPPGVPSKPPVPSQDDVLRFELLGAVPAILAGIALLAL